MIVARYIQLPQFICMLAKGLYIPKTSMFSDELEGLASVMFNQFDEGPAPKMENDWAKEWIYTSCWYKSTEESMAMWNLYGTNNEALMIQTTTEKLSNALLTSKYKTYPAMLNFVSYFEAAEYPKPLYIKQPHKNSHSPCKHLFDNKLDDFFYKHPSYRHEQEIRLCVIERSAETPYQANKNMGIVIPLELDFIDSVVFAPNATPWFKEVVKDVMKKYQIKAQVTGSELDWHKEVFSPNMIMF